MTPADPQLPRSRFLDLELLDRLRAQVGEHRSVEVDVDDQVALVLDLLADAAEARASAAA